MYAHYEFEHPTLGQDLALHMCPRPDHVPVVRATQATVVEKVGNANVNLNLEIWTTVVLDEQGEVSGIASGIVRRSRGIIEMVDLDCF